MRLFVITFASIFVSVSINRNVNSEKIEVKRATTKQLNCQYDEYARLKFIGNAIGITKETGVDACAATCFSYLATAKKQCKSVNYYASNKQCLLMDQQLDATNANMVKAYTESNADSTYAVPIACRDDISKPVPNPKPNPIPEPAPAPKPIPKGTCGQSIVPSKTRIVGGSEATPHAYPWILSMQRYKGIHFCGATLVPVNNNPDESDIIITAAHCVEDPSRKINVIAGAHKPAKTEDGTDTVEVEKIISHPDYKMKSYNDIAVLKLVRPIKFGSWIQPACLPAQNEKIADNTAVIASGWGNVKENGSSPDGLQQVTLAVVNPDECSALFKKNGWPLALKPDIHLCAGYIAGGKDTCQGDSGGPLISRGSKGFVLHGVVSFGQGCARPNSAGVYARVSSFINWITDTMKANSAVYKSG